MMSQKSKNKSSEPDIAARISASELISAKQRFDHVTTEIPVLPTTPQEFITINWCFHKVASYRTNFMAATHAFLLSFKCSFVHFPNFLHFKSVPFRPVYLFLLVIRLHQTPSAYTHFLPDFLLFVVSYFLSLDVFNTPSIVSYFIVSSIHIWVLLFCPLLFIVLLFFCMPLFICHLSPFLPFLLIILIMFSFYNPPVLVIFFSLHLQFSLPPVAADYFLFFSPISIQPSSWL